MRVFDLAITCLLIAPVGFATVGDALANGATKACENDFSQFAKTAAPAKLSLPQIMEKMDATAEALSRSNELTSPRRWREESASYGLPALDLPEKFGGMNLPAKDMVQVFEHAGKKALDLRDVVGAGHARALLARPGPVTKAVIEKVARGKGYMAIAITEPEAGSNMRQMRSVSEKVDGGYLLTGEKLYNARLTSATDVIIFTQAPGGRPGKLNAFVLPIDYPGLKITNLEAHGLKGNSFGGVSFDHVFVPEKYRIGKDGEGGKLFNNHFLYWRAMMSAAAIGTGKGALEQAARRMLNRKAFGGPIGRFTHLQQELAEHTAKLHMASLLVSQAAEEIDHGNYTRAAPLVAMAKAEGVEFALKASDFAMRVFGAEGYSSKVDLAQRVADLQGLRIADGTTDVLRQDVVRKIYGEHFWNLAMGDQGTHPATAISDANSSVAATAGKFEAAVTGLQKQQKRGTNVLAYQSDYDCLIDASGGGSCATASAFNFFQALRSMSGAEKALEPQSVVKDAFKAMPDLRKGRVTDQQLIGLLHYFQSKYLPDVKVNIRTDLIRTSNPRARTAAPEASALKFAPGELKLLTLTAKDGGKVIGRHFVVLKKASDGEITVLDPNRPAKDYVYKLVRSKKDPSLIDLARTDGGGDDDWEYTLESAFTATLKQAK